MLESMIYISLWVDILITYNFKNISNLNHILISHLVINFFELIIYFFDRQTK